MFAVLAVASFFNGIWLFHVNRGAPKTSPRWRTFGLSYIAVGVAMALAGVIIKWLWPGPWDHRTLVLEMVEIGLFAAMWVVQSIERWGKILQAAR